MPQKFLTFFIHIVLLFCVSTLQASQSDKIILSDTQQKRANALYEVVRCPVCSGQSLAGSEATIAQDLRKIINQKIHDNQSDNQIKQNLIRLYGDDILFEPPVNKATFLLNYGIYGILGIIFCFYLYYYRFAHRQSRVQGHNTSHFDSD